jgi:hypothetical protein
MFKVLAGMALAAAFAMSAPFLVSNSLGLQILSQAPAAFEYSDMYVLPSVVTVGDNVTVRVRVDNTGDLRGQYEASLVVDSSAADRQTGSLDSGKHASVVFVVPSGVAGNHSVSVGGLTGTYETKALPVPPSAGINWWLIIGIIIAAAAIAIFFLTRGSGEEAEKPPFRERLLRLFHRSKKPKSHRRKKSED